MIATYCGGWAFRRSCLSPSSSAFGSSGSLPSAPNCSSTLAVLSLASCTFGWSNGLIPRTQPDTAVANSAKKKIRPRSSGRSEEHTSELQSRFDLVCRLLLEKKKEINYYHYKWRLRIAEILDLYMMSQS